MDKMFRFLLGILLVQIATVVLVLLAPELKGIGWLRLLIPLLVIGVFAAFLFASMSKHKIKDEVNSASFEHAREKEKLQLNAERAKTRLVKKTQQQIARESKIAHSKANFKVGAAFSGTIALGALMLLTELLTLGLVTMSTAGGALGGYLLRAKKEYGPLLGDKADKTVKVIKQK
ncbi:MAG: Ca2+/Na+ antiporter [Cocleimonas sp.]|jgi:Ca2+/Na+ antiporter